MATKSIAWNTGSGNITLTYQGQGDGPISIQTDANNLDTARSQVINIETTAGSPAVVKNFTVSQGACPFPVGDVRDYAYNGSYYTVELPAGQYKLQCWGAQGGSNAADSSYSITAKAGGKGGYSEGILTLTEKTIVRVYVGGAGSSSAGGYNGGGSTSGNSTYNSGDTYGTSRMGGGGGATDIRLSDGALLSRMIVAGGGSGGAMCYRAITTESETSSTFFTYTATGGVDVTTVVSSENNHNYAAGANNYLSGSFSRGTFAIRITSSSSINYELIVEKTKWKYTNLLTITDDNWHTFEMPVDNPVTVIIHNNSSATSTASHTIVGGYYQLQRSVTLPQGHRYTLSYSVNSGSLLNTPAMLKVNEGYAELDQTSYLTADTLVLIAVRMLPAGSSITYTVTQWTTTSSTSTSKASQVGYVGGGTNGGGYNSSYYGKQNGAGSGGSFGQGANQTATNYRYCSGAGGGGWYGGGGGQHSDSSMTYCKYSGGGSGFVNTAANASYRPSGYTGLQLDSGETKAGNTSFPSTSGGTETGHSGNGYARITRLS